MKKDTKSIFSWVYNIDTSISGITQENSMVKPNGKIWLLAQEKKEWICHHQSWCLAVISGPK